jgi:hypothetical protein
MIEKFFEQVFYPLYYPYCKEKKNEQIRERRTRKAVSNMYRLFYYTTSTAMGYITLKDSFILPPGLGGSGSYYNQFKGYPYQEPHPLYRFYFTGTMGYHVGSMLFHFFSKHK